MEYADFKPVKKHDGYLIRDLGDNGTGEGAWVELCRVDGWGFGAMKIEDVAGVVTRDEKTPIPPTGRTLEAVFAQSPAAEQPVTPTEEDEDL